MTQKQRKIVRLAALTQMLPESLKKFQKMSLNSIQRLSFLLLLLALTVPSLSSGDWQASGNMSESNITEIYTAINSNPITSSTTAAQIDGVAQTISTRLNRLWDPAWNVVIVKQAPNHNAVLYGYAFRSHWFWMNGLTIPGDSSNFLAYIIWKDYNCQTWSTIGNLKTLGTVFGTDEFMVLTSYDFTQSIINDVWSTAFNFVKYAQASAAFSSGALSIVMTSHSNAFILGYVCTLNRRYFSLSNIYTPDQIVYYGMYMVFQTRRNDLYRLSLISTTYKTKSIIAVQK